MFILRLLSKFFESILHCQTAPTSTSHRLVTESMFRPATTLKPSVFRRRQLPYHLVQRCLHCSANRPGMRPSRWDHPSTLRPVDICAAFKSHSSIRQKDIHNDIHHLDLQHATYKHPNHKSRSPVSKCPNAHHRREFRQESSSNRMAIIIALILGSLFLKRRYLVQRCPSISLTLAVGASMTHSMHIRS